jgi:uncharacterized membrane protein YoaT (DUF817 family)
MSSILKFTQKLLHFGYQQALCCIFPVGIFITMAITKYVEVPHISRYDVILLVCIAIQAFMLLTKLESFDEFKVIGLFHFIGLGLELYKVHMGSWSYPGEAWSKIADVPLYSGFMHASVASYICQAWRRFDLRFIGWPKLWITFPIAGFIYVNFFTNHYVWDYRYVMIVVIVGVFWKSTVHFQLVQHVYRMPVVLSFLFIGFFIWIAENVLTFFGAWVYPNQEITWNVVHWGKITSWSLLVIISIVIVVNLKQIKYREVQS